MIFQQLGGINALGFYANWRTITDMDYECDVKYILLSLSGRVGTWYLQVAITVSWHHLIYIFLFKCSCRYIRRNQLDAGFPLFESVSEMA